MNKQMFGDCGIMPFSFDGVSSSTFWVVVVFLFISILVLFDLVAKNKNEFDAYSSNVYARDSVKKAVIDSAFSKIAELEKKVSELSKVLETLPTIKPSPKPSPEPSPKQSPKQSPKIDIQTDSETETESETESQID